MYYYQLYFNHGILYDEPETRLYKTPKAIRNPRKDVDEYCFHAKHINFFTYYWEKLNRWIDRW